MNKLSKKTTIIIICLIIAVGIVLDQLTKMFFENLFIQGKLPMYLFADVGFEYRLNYGGAWSIMAELNNRNIIFFVLNLLALPIFIVLMYMGRNKSLFGIFGYASIISGSIGNALDRALGAETFFDGAVRDFLSVGSWFPVFNVADCLLVCGTISVFLALLFLDDDALFRNIKKREVAGNSPDNNSSITIESTDNGTRDTADSQNNGK
ncbi:MAG: signal peptidase II [Clostridia bacterium]|nr:signal peptidase II [Clostridia bacterium]